jgi:superfamily I DNA/RNA helicase
VLESITNGTLTLNKVGGLVEQFRKLLIELKTFESLIGLDLIDKLFPANQEWAKALREAAILKVMDKTNSVALLDYLRTVVTQPEMPESGEYVRIMSLHKSKGLTSRVVIAAGCIQGLIPYIDEEEAPAEQKATREEQRRLFYVALTRSKEVLVLSSVTNLERNIAYKLGAVRSSGSGGYASIFMTELGPHAPKAKSGTLWQQQNYA